MPVGNTWAIETCADETIGVAENAAAISALASRVSLALKQAKSLEPIWEIADESPAVGRAAVQFRVDPDLFHSFFNSATGYRAMFRRGHRVGTFTNALLVAWLNDVLAGSLPEAVTAHLVQRGPKWRGRTKIKRSDFLRSLDPSLAKIWYCTAEIRSNGDIRQLPTGASDARINVGLAYEWMEIRQRAEDCLLELKGAFVGAEGLYQIKDPELRARTLCSKGEA